MKSSRSVRSTRGTDGDAPPIEVQATLVGDELVLDTVPESPLTVCGNRIHLEDGRVLVIRFRTFSSALRQ
jgi:hypothetical protein